MYGYDLLNASFDNEDRNIGILRQATGHHQTGSTGYVGEIRTDDTPRSKYLHLQQ